MKDRGTQEEYHVMMKVEIGVAQPQAKGYPKLPANHQKSRRGRENSLQISGRA